MSSSARTRGRCSAIRPSSDATASISRPCARTCEATDVRGGEQVEALEPRSDLGQQSGDLLADRSHGGDELPVGQPHDGGQDRLADRRERVATDRRPRGAAQDHERLAFRQEAAFNLVDQTRRAEPGHCLDEHGRRPALAGAGEHRAQVLEFTASSYKGGTRDGERHGAF